MFDDVTMYQQKVNHLQSEAESYHVSLSPPTSHHCTKTLRASLETIPDSVLEIHYAMDGMKIFYLL